MPNILIIDDDSHISEMIAKNLRNEGYSVCAAYSGTEALMLLSREELMPHIKDIPVIVVSAKANVSDKSIQYFVFVLNHYLVAEGKKC